MFIASILPRNFGKTITTTDCATLWTHLDEPDMSTLVGSSGHELAVDIVGSISKTISGGNKNHSWFVWLYGNWKNPEREWTKTALHHGYRETTALKEPSFDTTAVDIGMTGYHHDQHVWDDPIVKNKLREGGTYLDTVHAAVNASYKALATNGLLMLVCTRYKDNDVAGKHFEDEGIKTWDGMENPNTMVFRKHPMGAGVWRVFFWQVEDELTGRATCPEIMDEERIQQEKENDPEDFACQYQNDPGTSVHAPLTESQIRALYVDYATLRSEIPIDSASVHLDTAFKSASNIRKGDYSAIVPFLHDLRPNGIVYLDTDNILCSNAWRSEQYSDELIKVLLEMRKRLYYVKCITDEKEGAGKEGVYKSTLISAIRGAGLRVPRIEQFNRQHTKKIERIRKAAGLWAEGYVRILLHKEPGCKCNGTDICRHWIVPPNTRLLINQIMRVDVIEHDDLADASADVFQPIVWRKPTFESGSNAIDEGGRPLQPGDEHLQALSRPLSNEELKALLDESKEYNEDWNNGLGPDKREIPYMSFDEF